MSEKPTPAQQRAMDWLKGHSAKELGEIGTQIGAMMAEIIIDGLDARREADARKEAFDKLLAHFKAAIAAVIVKRGAGKRLVVTKAHFEKAVGKHIQVTEDDQTRIYELVDVAPEKKPEHDVRLARPN